MSEEIICPHCKKAFKVDEAGFADILKQVRDHEFEQELLERVKLLEKATQKSPSLKQQKSLLLPSCNLKKRQSLHS
jgi:hypothetical protein